jgi:hypothetical protein
MCRTTSSLPLLSASVIPSAPAWLQQARDEWYLVWNLRLREMPSLGDRVKEIRQGSSSAATNAADNDKNFVRSQVGLCECTYMGLRYAEFVFVLYHAMIFWSFA